MSSIFAKKQTDEGTVKLGGLEVTAEQIVDESEPLSQHLCDRCTNEDCDWERDEEVFEEILEKCTHPIVYCVDFED